MTHFEVMPEPRWLDPGVIEAIHLRQLAEHGGAAGIRDKSLLETALARPLQQASYSDPPPDLAALAAASGYGLAHLHPFVDGNKRTAFVATLLFLRLNGFDIEAPQEARYATFLALAAGESSESDLAKWLRARLKPIKA